MVCTDSFRALRGYLGSGLSMFQCLLWDANHRTSGFGSASGVMWLGGSMVNRVTHRCPPSWSP